MVKLNKIYTKTGDDGTTGLVRGPRRSKADLRVEAFGTVDEANSFIGMARLNTASMPKLDRMLARIQNDLFDLGSDIYNEALKPLTSFVLPGGTPLAVAMHLARTVTRRAERLVVELRAAETDVNLHALVYLNRLSDLLFVMARVANANGESDVLWVPGKSRSEARS
jgi:cob(I)alamin adenosyltransferase